MALNTASGFTLGSSDPIDDRLVLSKAQMKSANDNVYPDVYMCVCTDDGCIYTYNKTNEVDATTGKFRLFKSGDDSDFETKLKEFTQNNVEGNKGLPVSDTAIKNLMAAENGLATLDASGKLVASQLPTSAREIVGYMDASADHNLPDEADYENGNEIIITTTGYIIQSTAFTLEAGKTLTNLEVNQANQLIGYGYVFTLEGKGTVSSFATDKVTMLDGTEISLPYDSDLSATSTPATVQVPVKEGDSIMLIDGHWIHLSSTSGVESVNGKTGVVTVIEYTPDNKEQLEKIGEDDDGNFTYNGEMVKADEFTGTKAEWEALTDEEKAKYVIVNLTNDNGLSHKNLLTNSFFRINTKGLKVYDCSSVTFPFYTVNRWKIFDYGKVDVNNNGITLSNKLTAKGYIASPYIRQYFDDNIENYLGKTITVTLIFNDTEKYQKTYTFPTEKPTENTFFIQERIAENVDFILFVREKEGENINHPLVQIQIQNEILTSIKLNQIKIEFGEESTISEDTFDIEDYALCDNSIYDKSEGQGVSNIVTFTTVSDFKAFANLMTSPAMYLINIPVGSLELSLFLTKDVTASSLSGILTVKKGVTYGEINVDLFLYEGNMRIFASRYNPETETIVNLKIVDNSYSTSETVCGTWIDGKTIYRRVIETKTPSTANVTTKVFSGLSDIDKVIRIDGYIMFGSAEKGFVPVNGAIINNTTFKGTWIADNDVYMDVDAYYTNRNVYIITEYTKNDTE